MASRAKKTVRFRSTPEEKFMSSDRSDPKFIGHTIHRDKHPLDEYDTMEETEFAKIPPLFRKSIQDQLKTAKKQWTEYSELKVTESKSIRHKEWREFLADYAMFSFLHSYSPAEKKELLAHYEVPLQISNISEVDTEIDLIDSLNPDLEGISRESKEYHERAFALHYHFFYEQLMNLDGKYMRVFQSLFWDKLFVSFYEQGVRPHEIRAIIWNSTAPRIQRLSKKFSRGPINPPPTKTKSSIPFAKHTPVKTSSWRK